MSWVPEKDVWRKNSLMNSTCVFLRRRDSLNTIWIWKVIPFVQHNAELKAKKKKKPSTTTVRSSILSLLPCQEQQSICDCWLESHAPHVSDTRRSILLSSNARLRFPRWFSSTRAHRCLYLMSPPSIPLPQSEIIATLHGLGASFRWASSSNTARYRCLHFPRGVAVSVTGCNRPLCKNSFSSFSVSVIFVARDFKWPRHIHYGPEL